MKIKKMITIVSAAALVSGIAFSQPQEKIELPQLPLRDRLVRAVYQSVSQTCLDISFIKSIGKTVDDYNKFRVKLMAPSWDVIKGKGIGVFVTMLYVNGQLYEDYKLEVLEESDTAVKIRTNRPWAAFFDKDLTLNGVKLEEYEQFRALGMKELTAYLGFEYDERVEGGWLVISIAKKKQ